MQAYAGQSKNENKKQLLAAKLAQFDQEVNLKVNALVDGFIRQINEESAEKMAKLNKLIQ